MKGEAGKVKMIASLYAVALVAIFVEIALYSGAFRTKPIDPNSLPMFILYGKSVVDNNPEQLKEAISERPKFLKKAHELREALRPLSLNHRDLIQKMLSQKESGTALFDALKNKLPRTSPKEFFCSPPTMHDPLDFTWDVIDPFAGDNQSSPQVIQARERLRFEKLSYVKIYHDCPISISAGSGVNKITLWMSGRVTETYTWAHYRDRTFVQPEEVTGKREEIKSVVDGNVITIEEPFEFFSRP